MKRGPFFLLFGFNKGTVKYEKGKRVLLRNLVFNPLSTHCTSVCQEAKHLRYGPSTDRKCNVEGFDFRGLGHRGTV